MNRSLGFSLLLSAGLVLLLSACSPRRDERGIRLDPESVAAVKVGQTRSEVVKTIGNPSTKATFNDRNWYYLSRRTVTWVFLRPFPTDQSVVVVNFDDAGLVTKVSQTDGFDENIDVSATDRVTPSKGHKYGLMQDFLGNLGRFNSGKSGR